MFKQSKRIGDNGFCKLIGLCTKFFCKDLLILFTDYRDGIDFCH